MTTESMTVDKAAIEAAIEATIEAEVELTIEMAKSTVRRELAGIDAHAVDLKAAVTIKHQYLAGHPDDSLVVEYHPCFAGVRIGAQLTDFASLPVLLRMLREARYSRKSEGKTFWAELEYYYDRTDEQNADYDAIKLTVSAREVPGAVCRRVKIGTHASPVYEIQCDGKPVVDTPDPELATP